jgi:hypothetical protein
MPQLYAHTADHTAYTALFGVYVYDDMIFWVIIRFLKTLGIIFTAVLNHCDVVTCNHLAA